jgi:hypothetical protein
MEERTDHDMAVDGSRRWRTRIEATMIFAMSATEWMRDRLARLRGKRPSVLTEREVADEIRQLEDTLAKMIEAPVT